MQLTVPESVALARVFARTKLADFTSIICPSAPALAPVAAVLRGSAWKLGAQDCAEETGGAVTGGVSAVQLRSAGAQWIILGHSECRARGETSQSLKEKLARAAEQKLGVIFCVGETSQKMFAVSRRSFLEKQLAVVRGYSGKLLIAYEPVWAIGKGKSCAPDAAAHVIAEIKNWCVTAGWTKIPVLYGGSVDAKTIGAYLRQKEIDGCLVGGASSDTVKARALLAVCAQATVRR